VPLTLEQKQAVVSEVAEIAHGSLAAIAAEYRGLNVAKMTDLRVRAKNSGVYMRVVRNTLARLAVEDTQFACMREHLTGPLVLAFSLEDPGAAARVMRDFAKENERLQIRLVAFGGKLLEPAQIDRLAKLPTREEALARLAAVMKAPIARLVRTIAEPHARLVRTFGAVRDHKQSAG